MKDALSAANYKFRVYSQDFKGGEEDPNILPLVGKRGWAMLTCDSKNRYRDLERKLIMRYRVRQFVFAGNLGAATLGNLIVSVYPKMRTFAREHERPFVAGITKSGDIYLRMDHKGHYEGASRFAKS